MKLVKFFGCALVIAVTLFASCENPLLNEMLPESSEGEESKPADTGYTVTFDKNHTDAKTTGWTEAQPQTMKVTPPKTTIKELPGTKPTRPGYKFVEWNTHKDRTAEDAEPFDEQTEVKKNIKVYAQWEAIAYTIELDVSGDDGDDAVTFWDKVNDTEISTPTIGSIGNTITISYTLDDINTHNRLTFTGAVFVQVNKPETDTIDYTVKPGDAKTGNIITIHAVFSHSPKELDTIAFANTQDETVTYGANNNKFTKAITKTGAGSGAITYDSSDTSVATVDNTGEVTILKVGTTTITATKAEDDEYAEATAYYELTIIKADGAALTGPVTGKEVTDESIEIEPISPPTGEQTVVEYAISKTSVAQADEDDLDWQTTLVFDDLDADTEYHVFARTQESANHKAGAAISAVIKTLSTTVTPPTLTPDTITFANSAENKTYGGAKFTNTLTDGAGSGVVAYTSDDEDVATVDATGEVTIKGAGTAIITAYKPSDGIYEEAEDEYTLTVAKAAGGTIAAVTAVATDDDEITVTAVTPPSAPGDEAYVIEYACSTGTEPTTGWQEGVGTADIIFDGLTADTYYVYVRTKETDNYEAGTAKVSDPITVGP